MSGYESKGLGDRVVLHERQEGEMHASDLMKRGRNVTAEGGAMSDGIPIGRTGKNSDGAQTFTELLRPEHRDDPPYRAVEVVDGFHSEREIALADALDKMRDEYATTRRELADRAERLLAAEGERDAAHRATAQQRMRGDSFKEQRDTLETQLATLRGVVERIKSWPMGPDSLPGDRWTTAQDIAKDALDALSDQEAGA